MFALYSVFEIKTFKNKFPRVQENRNQLVDFAMIDFQFYLVDLKFVVMIEQPFDAGKMLKSHASDP